jgi:sugar lactone lactonase YvrE
MKSRGLFLIIAGSLGTAVLLGQVSLAGQAPAGRRTGPGVQAAQDAREPEVLAKCKNPPSPPAQGGAAGRAGGREGGGGGQGRGPAVGNPMAQEYTVTAIPGVIAAGQRWKASWQGTGNNADGILGVDDGSVWIAQNDNSDIVKVDKNGTATVVYKDTNTGGAVAINSKGIVYVASRGLNPAILEVAPQHKVFANSYQGDPLDCIGGTMHDLVVDSKGGVYFALGNPAFYADPKGVITKYGDENLRGNGITLSPDEKRLYITNGPSLVAFDVQPNGSLTNQREFAKWEGGGGDGICVDDAGRIYVSGSTIRVIGPDGKELGAIPTPFGTTSVAFGGPDKKTLYAVGGANVDGVRQVQLIGIQMTAQGYRKRAK